MYGDAFTRCTLVPMYPYIWTAQRTNGEGNGTPLQYSCLENPMDGGAWWAAVHGVVRSRTRLSDFTLTFHFHALEKEMATHSSVHAWRIPGTGEPGGLPSMGLHRVGHDWNDLAAAVAAAAAAAEDQKSWLLSFQMLGKNSKRTLFIEWLVWHLCIDVISFHGHWMSKSLQSLCRACTVIMSTLRIPEVKFLGRAPLQPSLAAKSRSDCYSL